MRGYFELGIYRPKTETNVGTLWRSAYQLGASGIFTIGRRYEKQSSDTLAAWRHVPLRHFLTIDEMLAARPYSCELVGIEMGGKPLADFAHPERATYLLGAEEFGLPAEILAKCNRIVSLESINAPSFNVAVAGSIVAYSRVFGLGGRAVNLPRKSAQRET
jgi:tRNA G18 (ribose-2'-O)-methylase SpoU